MSGAAPAWRITRGRPAAEETAALLAVLTALLDRPAARAGGPRTGAPGVGRRPGAPRRGRPPGRRG
ncbi:acyl-CoA carboxylase epsilon subunit, partial [Streptomyces sp. NPDC058728]|uniref:acyl-CoA carboxylase epsilon subunit n=1 Tax=Streptomyces sp. NPDC058728 TaxID=3346612 RepID=UPI0036B4DB63